MKYVSNIGNFQIPLTIVYNRQLGDESYVVEQIVSFTFMKVREGLFHILWAERFFLSKLRLDEVEK
jgi:hypothetical protein